jgi:hypothetical protein
MSDNNTVSTRIRALEEMSRHLPDFNGDQQNKPLNKTDGDTDEKINKPQLKY